MATSIKANAAKERNFDRSFVLIGKACSGKSTLGNLLLSKKAHFKTHKFHEASSITREIHTGEEKLKACQIYDYANSKEMVKIQIIDQPGSNDTDFTQEKYCKLLTKCIAESKAEMSATFLILVDINSRFFTSEEFLTIFNLAEILSDCRYSFFPNAIIVFTHADKLDKHLNQEKLEELLEEKLQNESFAGIKDLIDLVDERYIFINGENKSELNRYGILREIFQLSRCSLNLYINGNNGFNGEDFKHMLNETADSFEKNLIKYDLNYQFNPDLNLFSKYEIKKVDERIADDLAKLSGISTGISAMVLLISLEEFFNEEIYKLIMGLPETYNLGEEFKKDFWNYACIIFKVPVDKKDFVKQNIERNRILRTFVAQVNSRYTWMTNETPPEECSLRLVELVKKIKLQTEGKNYTEKIILADMKKTITQAAILKGELGDSQMVDKVTNARIQKEIPFYCSKGDNSQVFVAANKFLRNKKAISLLKGYFILRNINPKIANQFREKFQDRKEIPNKVFAEFCFEEIGKFEAGSA